MNNYYLACLISIITIQVKCYKQSQSFTQIFSNLSIYIKNVVSNIDESLIRCVLCYATKTEFSSNLKNQYISTCNALTKNIGNIESSFVHNSPNAIYHSKSGT